MAGDIRLPFAKGQGQRKQRSGQAGIGQAFQQRGLSAAHWWTTGGAVCLQIPRMGITPREVPQPRPPTDVRVARGSARAAAADIHRSDVHRSVGACPIRPGDCVARKKAKPTLQEEEQKFHLAASRK
jgi:hypothetical protein